MLATLSPIEEYQSLFDSYISIAADSLERLRMCDLYRVLEQAQDVDQLCLLSEYILAKRKDFDVAEVIEQEAELMAERGWKAKVCSWRK